MSSVQTADVLYWLAFMSQVWLWLLQYK